MARLKQALIAVVFMTMLMLAANASMADNTGVMIIQGPDETERVCENINLNDLKEGQLVSIPGYADFRIEKVEFADWVEHTYDLLDTEYGYSSGESADYLRLRFWVLKQLRSRMTTTRILTELSVVLPTSINLAVG